MLLIFVKVILEWKEPDRIMPIYGLSINFVIAMGVFLLNLINYGKGSRYNTGSL
jgi:hypothetical protein